MLTLAALVGGVIVPLMRRRRGENARPQFDSPGFKGWIWPTIECLPAAALVLTVGFTTVCVIGSAKIFRIGILSQGQTPTYRNLIGWLLSR